MDNRGLNVRVVACVTALLLGACASNPSATSEPRPVPSTTPTGSAGPGAPPPLINTAWPVQTREHVDLWLHTYAMLAADTMPVPYFSRGYRDRLTNLRRQRGTSSLLDQTRDRLL